MRNADHDDLIGKRFGYLTVLEFAGHKNKRMHYLCRCDCGKEKTVDKYSLLTGHTISCGCLRRYNARLGREPEQIKTDPLKLEEIKKQNVIISDKDFGRFAESLCNYCIRSAAPPSLQCVWDESRAKILPDGAEISIMETNCLSKKNRDGVLIKVINCPLYVDIRKPENKALLLEERRKHKEQMKENDTGEWW